MDIASKYDLAAPTWAQKLTQLGYPEAYDGFLAGRTLPQGPVLDVGTGDGGFARAWIGAGGCADLTLLDPSRAMLAQAGAQFSGRGLSPRLVNAPLETFRPDSPFAAVLAAHVLEHVADPTEGLRHLARCLCPKGRLYLVVSRPHWCNWLIWLRFRHRWFAADHVRQMAAEAGLAHHLTHRFTSGPPSRTSLGYIFTKP